MNIDDCMDRADYFDCEAERNGNGTKMGRLMNKAWDLGGQAFTDGWMRFAVEDFSDYDLLEEDVCGLMQSDQSGWEQTNHYQEIYRKRMREWIEEAFEIESYDDAYIDKMNDLTIWFFDGFYDVQDISEMIKKEKLKRGLC